MVLRKRCKTSMISAQQTLYHLWIAFTKIILHIQSLKSTYVASNMEERQRMGSAIRDNSQTTGSNKIILSPYEWTFPVENVAYVLIELAITGLSEIGT